MTNLYFDQFKNKPAYKILLVILIMVLVLKIGYEIGYAGYQFGQWLKAR
jgi:Tfp pilus assembly protein PilO